jgi:CCR4-NOT transcriptional regulation complex NOT5 subunit
MSSLRSDKVSVAQVSGLKDEIDNYLEQNQEPDFFEDEFLYDQLDLSSDAEDDDDEDDDDDDDDDLSSGSDLDDDDEQCVALLSPCLSHERHVLMWSLSVC